ncbi:unnamed protein product [Ostreobium quekettii]|uniref:Uncharacterized protein n=1 Tax=Ostreobium quekettii TaxID=121088 RepID=A0A8S1J3S6_9CHLO|nr:unnamed protein product [Ostreobium quekettii]
MGGQAKIGHCVGPPGAAYQCWEARQSPWAPSDGVADGCPLQHGSQAASAAHPLDLNQGLAAGAEVADHLLADELADQNLCIAAKSIKRVPIAWCTGKVDWGGGDCASKFHWELRRGIVRQDKAAGRTVRPSLCAMEAQTYSANSTILAHKQNEVQQGPSRTVAVQLCGSLHPSHKIVSITHSLLLPSFHATGKSAAQLATRPTLSHHNAAGAKPP